MSIIKFKRGTRAQLGTAATANQLRSGEPYVITDESRLAIGTSSSTYTEFLKDGEGGVSGVVSKPTNATPTNNAVDVVPPLVITASAFSSTGAAPHSTARYQLSSSSDFSVPLYESHELAAAVSYTIEPGLVGFGEVVYWRIRFKDALGVLSEWSTPTKFETRGISVVTKPTNTLPTNGATEAKRSQALTASAFSSTQGATHQATRVQVSSSAAFTVPRLDVTLGAVTIYKIPKDDWLSDATEYWRIQYQNSLGIWSDWSDATNYTTALVVEVSATGGTITQDGDYNVHTFTAGGTFEIDGDIDADVLVVAGGGGGGSLGGGGGGGGVIYQAAKPLVAGSYAISIGSGGAGGAGNASGGNGQNTTMSGMTAAVGGGGGAGHQAAGKTGGSGGGGQSGAPGSGTAGQGYPGGNGATTSLGGGGGGGGGSGQNSGGAGGAGGVGGPGFACSISPAATHYAGGGGGGVQSGYGSGGGAGGSGGGGNAVGFAAGVAGAANTGGGGGGGGYSGAFNSGGAGGSGIVIVRYLR